MATIMTLTEALAAYKLTLKKIDDKTRTISHYTVRDERLVDPLTKSGSTSEKYIATERQAITDLTKYAISLKAAIAARNKEVMVNMGALGKMTLEEAIIWRRDIYPKITSLHNGMLTQARKARDGAITTRPDQQVPNIVVNFDEKEVMEALTQYQDAHDKMDTQLSILNATTTVEV